MNSSTGVLTATARGTTIGAARTSGTVTKKTVGTWTPTSGYNAAGVKTDTDSKTAKCTQAMNTITSLEMTGVRDTPAITDAPASSDRLWFSEKATFSSGATSEGKNYKDYITFKFDQTSWATWTPDSQKYFGVLDIASRGTTIGAARTGTLTCTISGTINGVSINVTDSVTITQAANTVTYSNPTVSLSYGVIPAAGGSVLPTVSYSQTATYTSGSSKSITSGGSISYSGTSVSPTSGTVSAASKGTAISNTTTVTTATVTVSLNGKSGSKSAVVQQSGNYVTALELVPRSFSYTAISAGATSANPSVWGGSTTFVFTSGSKTTTIPTSTYGTLSSIRKYSLGSVVNGFTAVNPETGVLTATSRGTTIGPARTSGVVTYTVDMTWTPTSSYNSGGVVAGEASNAATCTQALNTVQSVQLTDCTGGVPAVHYSASGGAACYVGHLTYTSGHIDEGSAYRDYITFSLTSTFGTWTPNSAKYYGVVTVASRGTVEGAQKSGTLTYKISGTINGVSVNKTATLALTQAANVKSYEYTDLQGHIGSTTWPARSDYTTFWATGSYVERYSSGATGASGSGSIPWDSVNIPVSWVTYSAVTGHLTWETNTGAERYTTITGKVGSWAYPVSVTQRGGAVNGILYVRFPSNTSMGSIPQWRITVHSSAGGQLWGGSAPETGQTGGAYTIRLPDEAVAAINNDTSGQITISCTYATSGRYYSGSPTGTELDELRSGGTIYVDVSSI